MIEIQSEHDDEYLPTLYQINPNEYEAILLYRETDESLKKIIYDKLDEQQLSNEAKALVRGIAGRGGPGGAIDLMDWIVPSVKFIIKEGGMVIVAVFISDFISYLKKRLPNSTYIFEIKVKSHFLSFYFPKYLTPIETQEAYKKLEKIVEDFEDPINFVATKIRYMYNTKDQKWHDDI